MIGVIVIQNPADPQSFFPEDPGGILVYISTGGLGWAVGSIGSHRKDGGVVQPFQAYRRRKGNLLIPSAQAAAGQVDNRFTTGQKCQASENF